MLFLTTIKTRDRWEYSRRYGKEEVSQVLASETMVRK